MTEFPRSLLSLGPDDDLDVIAEISATLDALKPKQPADAAIDIHERGQREQENYTATQRIIQDTEKQARHFAMAAIIDAQDLLARLGDEDVAIQIIGTTAYERLQQMAHDQEHDANFD